MVQQIFSQITMLLKPTRMLKSLMDNQCSSFFNPVEIDKITSDLVDKNKNQLLDDITIDYDPNYRNCILCCTHNKKFD